MKLTILLIFTIISLISASLHEPLPAEVKYELEVMLGSEISFDDIDTSKAYRFNGYEDIEFELYTQSNPNEHQRVLIDNADSLENSNFNPKHPTRFLIHGGFTNGSSESIQYPKNGYMKKGDFNVFGVNWSKGAHMTQLPWMKQNMRDVGTVVGQFIQFLIKDGSADMKDMAVIGHSAGAIIVSFVGKGLNGTLPVIISLDPPRQMSNYYFDATLPEKSDAKYVEVMHTSGIMNHKPIGHSDFYPNGGRTQVPCDDEEQGMTIDNAYKDHMIAIDFFAECIYSETGFWSKRCDEYEDINETECKTKGAVSVYRLMGAEPIDPLTNGVFWLSVNNCPPYAKGFK